MEKSEMLKKLEKIFIEEMDNEDIVLSEKTAADDIEEWDSLSHIMLIVAIEKEFKFRFTSQEIQSWNNVGNIIDCIKAK